MVEKSNQKHQQSKETQKETQKDRKKHSYQRQQGTNQKKVELAERSKTQETVTATNETRKDESN